MTAALSAQPQPRSTVTFVPLLHRPLCHWPT